MLQILEKIWETKKSLLLLIVNWKIKMFHAENLKPYVIKYNTTENNKVTLLFFEKYFHVFFYKFVISLFIFEIKVYFAGQILNHELEKLKR